MDVIVHKIEPQFDNPLCIPNSGDSDKYNYSIGGDGKKINHAAMLEYIRAPRRSTVQYRDGFFAASDLVEPAYTCECGFNGMFEDSLCAKCGKRL